MCCQISVWIVENLLIFGHAVFFSIAKTVGPVWAAGGILTRLSPLLWLFKIKIVLFFVCHFLTINSLFFRNKSNFIHSYRPFINLYQHWFLWYIALKKMCRTFDPYCIFIDLTGHYSTLKLLLKKMKNHEAYFSSSTWPTFLKHKGIENIT